MPLTVISIDIFVKMSQVLYAVCYICACRIRENEFESHRISVQAVADPSVAQSSENLNPDVLNPTNFEEYVKNHDLVMIEFYAP